MGFYSDSLTGKEIVHRRVGQEEIQIVSRKVGNGWNELGRELTVKESVLSNVFEEVTEGESQGRTSYERCCQVLQWWIQNEGSNATVRVLMTSLTECGFGDIVRELAEHLLAKTLLTKQLAKPTMQFT